MISTLLAQLLVWADAPPPQKSIFHKLWHLVCRIVLISAREFQRNGLSLRASALTYTIMLSLVPMLAISTAVVKGLGGGDELRTIVYSYVKTLEQDKSPPREVNRPTVQPPADQSPSDQLPEDQPSSNITQHLFSAVDKIFDYVDKTNFATLGTVGVLGMFLSVIFVLGNVEAAMNSIWHVASGRSIVRKIADYLALIVLMPISVNIGFAASAVLKNDTLLSYFTQLLPTVWIHAVILTLFPIFFLTLTLYVIYVFFPHTKVKTLPALAGALFAGFFWFQVQNLYISLQVGVANYNAIYGSFATLPLFLIWIYCGWIFILIGAQIAYAVQNHQGYRLTAVETQASHRLSIAFDIMSFVEESFLHKAAARLEDFQEKFPMHQPDLVNETTAELIRHDLIHQSESDGSLKPSTSPGKEQQAEIIAAILGCSFSTTDGGRRSCEALTAAASAGSQSASAPGEGHKIPNNSLRGSITPDK